MISSMLKSHYSRFLADPERLHFAAHSHHPWPDVTRQAVLDCWDDAARLVDRKWEHVFGTVLPKARAHVARILDLSRPEQVALGANTHEFLMRILSCFEETKPLRILTTDSEFYSFARQAERLEELERVRITRVPTEPFGTFAERFGAACSVEHELVYLSQVFFNSGFALASLPTLVRAVRHSETVVVIDGYHAFGAVPTSLREVEDRVFYLGGGYKYAQAGEGFGYLHVPKGCRLRPVNTGWFSRFGTLTAPPRTGVLYPEDGFRFWGATFEPTGAYRFNAAMDWMEREDLSVEKIHGHVRALQERFLRALEKDETLALPATALVTPRDLRHQGHFLTFRLPEAPEMHRALRDRHVETDLRGDRIRFGFGLYHDPEDVDRLLERLATMERPALRAE
jgi:selenocysteine lyase/cysteine desulfurase